MTSIRDLVRRERAALIASQQAICASLPPEFLSERLSFAPHVPEYCPAWVRYAELLRLFSDATLADMKAVRR